jgi:hypothetical protein
VKKPVRVPLEFKLTSAGRGSSGRGSAGRRSSAQTPGTKTWAAAFTTLVLARAMPLLDQAGLVLGPAGFDPGEERPHHVEHISRRQHRRSASIMTRFDELQQARAMLIRLLDDGKPLPPVERRRRAEPW